MRHCFACQKRTGSVFGAQARFPRAQVRIEGRSQKYVRTADSGNDIAFSFCPACGSTVHYVLQQFPDLIAIPIGAFAIRKSQRRNIPYTNRAVTTGSGCRMTSSISIER
jgi:hypothetical protein